MANSERRQRGPLDPELPSTKTDFSEKYDTSSLKNKVALITGGATGIGQGISIGLAEAGAYVTIADINVADAEETVKTLTAAGHKAQFVHTDVSSWDALVGAFKAAVEFGPGEGEEKTLDIVIPAAGISHPGIRSWLNEAKVNEKGDPEPLPLKVLDINLDAVFNTAHLAMYYFKKFPGKDTSDKQIVFVASMGGYTSMTGVLDYCTSKWAVRGLFRALRGARYIMGEQGPALRCNLIAPTFVKTNMTKAYWGHMEKMGVKLAEVSDCTDVLLRMCADEKVNGRAAAIAGDRASFDLCDDAEGLDAGREVGLSISENRFGYKAPVKEEPAAPTAEVPADVPKETNGVVLEEAPKAVNGVLPTEAPKEIVV